MSGVNNFESYLDMKEMIYSCMEAQNPGINPMSYASGFAIDYSLLLHEPEDYELMQAFIACGLFELEHNNLEERIEAQMTYWIYQYEHFNRFKDVIPDCNEMEKDIVKIKTFKKLRFEDLECYEADN